MLIYQCPLLKCEVRVPRQPGGVSAFGGEAARQRPRAASGLEKPSRAGPAGPRAFAGEAPRAAALCFSVQPLPALHAAGFGFTE